MYVCLYYILYIIGCTKWIIEELPLLKIWKVFWYIIISWYLNDKQRREERQKHVETIIFFPGVYICPPPFFQKWYFSPKCSENFPFFLVFPLFPLIFAFYLSKSSYFFPTQPILHIFAPPLGGELRIYTPLFLPW